MGFPQPRGPPNDTHLKDNGALKDNEHEQGEKRVIPVFVEAPEGNAEYLEDKERRDSVLGEELGELWDRDVAEVLAVLLKEFRDARARRLRDRRETLGRLERCERRSCVTRVRQVREDACDR